MTAFRSFNALLADLDGVSSTTSKKDLIAEYGRDGTTAALLLAALSPFVRFGIKRLDAPSSFAPYDAPPTLFFNLMEDLRARRLTGHAAKEAIEECLSQYTAETAENLARVLRKNLKVSIGASLVNSALGHDLIVEYGVMLADKMTPKFDWSGGPWFVEYKYDGMRLIAEVDLEANEVQYFSRNGLPQDYVPAHITTSILEAARKVGTSCVFDGEVYGVSYTYTMKAMKKATNPSADLRFVVFDFMTMEEWVDRSCPHPLMRRRAVIERLVAEDGDRGLRLSRGMLCTTRDEVETFYQALVEEGAEGVIIKKLDSLYSWKRTKDWTKYKPVYTADLECYEIYEGDKDSEFEGTFGGARLRGYLEDGTYVECDCGSGFRIKRENGYDQPLRDEIWKNPALIIGKTCEVEYQEVTQAQNKPHKSLRFVIFKHIRTDK